MGKILITGGAGFIGSTLANFLAKENEVVIIDDLSMGKLSNLNNSSNITFIEGSVTDGSLMKSIIKESEYDYIYHLAAIASVADSVERPVETHQVNFQSVLMLLELVRKYNPMLKRLVFSSSAAVYGDEPTLPKQEESVIRPLTPYAIDKLAAEKYVLAYNNLYNIPTSAVRFFNVYGPNQNPNSPYSGVISIIIEQFQKIVEGKEGLFKVFGDGSQSRDFVYVADVIQALILIATSSQSLGEVYNVGTGNETSLNQLLCIIKEKLDIELRVEYCQNRNGDIEFSYANIAKLNSLGFKNEFDIECGLTDYLDTIF